MSLSDNLRRLARERLPTSLRLARKNHTLGEATNSFRARKLLNRRARLFKTDLLRARAECYFAPCIMVALKEGYDLAAEVLRLKRQRNAIILAHNYQVPEIQDVADYVGDSLGLSFRARETDADVIVFCGVHFMAETARTYGGSRQRELILPDLDAGCSLQNYRRKVLENSCNSTPTRIITSLPTSIAARG